jgi:hypothetical protein
MANPEHLDIFKQGVEIWNGWRQKNAAIRPNLSRIDFSGTDLSGFDLIGTDLSKANLSGADLSGANLSRAYFIEAELRSTLHIDS